MKTTSILLIAAGVLVISISKMQAQMFTGKLISSASRERQVGRAETHPNLEINFISLQILGFKDKSDIKAVVDITLAGSTTLNTISYHASIKPNGDVL